jgi:leucyl aminopeptidase
LELKSKKLEKQLDAIAKWTANDADLIKRDFAAEKGASLTIYHQNTTCYLLGLGVKPSADAIEKAFQNLIIRKRKQLGGEIGIQLLAKNEPSSKKIATWIEAMARGIRLGSYDIGMLKSKKKNKHPLGRKGSEITCFLASKESKKIKRAFERGEITAESILEMLDLVNAPGNYKLPKRLADWAIEAGKKFDFDVCVMDKKTIAENGMDALLAVNRGSEHPPAFIIMEYKPKSIPNKKLTKIGLAGKGVTFDTGGLSLKGPQNMHYMKSDMGGAAAVLGTMAATARLQLPVHLIGVIPATDNSVDALAIKPGDVINSYSGKTIEVIDTDAEGRLILADGLAYLNKNFEPDVMIDLATLTGSCVRTLGYEAGGLFTKNKKLAKTLIKAGEESGDLLWQLPLWDVYLNDIQSDVADIKNLGARPLAGATIAGKFLEFFTDKHPTWAHLDIAGVAFGNSPFSKDKSATGFGIRLLLKFIEKWNISTSA